LLLLLWTVSLLQCLHCVLITDFLLPLPLPLPNLLHLFTVTSTIVLV
jgi:hypothetical protein